MEDCMDHYYVKKKKIFTNFVVNYLYYYFCLYWLAEELIKHKQLYQRMMS